MMATKRDILAATIGVLLFTLVAALVIGWAAA
jgi:preprotein translocase subunit SecE